MSTNARLLVLIAIVHVVQIAHPAAQGASAFEVVSIKRSLSTDTAGGSLILPDGRYTATNVPLILLLDVAYRTAPERIIGGPAWIRSDRYNVEARARPNTSPDDIGPMLQSVLRERFQLKAQLEKRDTPVYALVLRNVGGPAGPGIRPATFNCDDMQSAKRGLATLSADGVPGCGDRRAPGRWLAGGVSLAALEDVLAPVVGRPVVDRTNSDRRFDIRLEWTRDVGADGVSIFTALREQLGLQLESRSLPLDVLVIESVQRPTEN